jgi:AcrR family transcriptional regulator
MSSLNVKRKRGRPVASEKLDTTVLLEAALVVFSEHGYEGAQLKEVAAMVGVTTPLISYHFENKEDLWKQSIIHLSAKIMERYEEVRKEHSDLSGIALLKAFLSFPATVRLSCWGRNTILFVIQTCLERCLICCGIPLHRETRFLPM